MSSLLSPIRIKSHNYFYTQEVRIKHIPISHTTLIKKIETPTRNTSYIISVAHKINKNTTMMNKIISIAMVIAILQVSLQRVHSFSFQSQVSNSRIQGSHLQSSVLDDLVRERTSGASRSLPPLLQDMADERREFEVNLGKAMDTLRKDYPTMLYKTPSKLVR